MQPVEVVQEGGMLPQMGSARPAVPFLARFLGKFVLDIMPAALASVIGGFLFTQYQFGHSAPTRPLAEQAAPASAEMLALVRDEHAVIIDYLKAQTAAEKSRLAAQDANGHDAEAATAADTQTAARAADARVALEASARRIAAATASVRSASSHTKPPAAVVATHGPLVIAQVDQYPAPQQEAPPADRIARDPDSLLGKTLDVKDHVVAAARHVVFAIGDVFASVGEHITGVTPSGRLFSSDS